MNYRIILLFILAPLLSFAQVGINTTTPTATLDVNGAMRLRGANVVQGTVSTTKVLGVDGEGYVQQITVGKRLKLQTNILSAGDYSFGTVTFTSDDDINDADFLIDVNGVNRDKSILRIIQYKVNGDLKDVKLTGIKAGYDGQSIWLYAQTKSVTLKENDDDSISANRIEKNGDMKVDPWEMVQIVYDGVRQKWILMNNDD